MYYCMHLHSVTFKNTITNWSGKVQLNANSVQQLFDFLLHLQSIFDCTKDNMQYIFCFHTYAKIHIGKYVNKSTSYHVPINHDLTKRRSPKLGMLISSDYTHLKGYSNLSPRQHPASQFTVVILASSTSHITVGPFII